jgi:aldose 1-epimerase
MKAIRGLLFLGLAMFAGLWACRSEKGGTMKTEKIHLWTTSEGRSVDLYTLTNSNGAEMKVMSLGGVVYSLRVPDRNGKMEDVILGFEDFHGYEKNKSYFNALIGRFGNRIAGGTFVLNGQEYRLATNDGSNHLHGGNRGFETKVWDVTPIEEKNAVGLVLKYESADKEEGYPGKLSVQVTYLWNDSNQWKIAYEARTDKETIVNLTQHAYFNLSGNGARNILGHELVLAADRFTPINKKFIPTGELRSVKNTPMDFTRPQAIGVRIDQPDEQILRGLGYDHNWVLNSGGGALALAGTLYDPISGRLMEVYTTQPGIQFYSGNFLDGSVTGKYGKSYTKRFGLCLETQHFPDSPNQPNFPTVVLKPGEIYSQTTVYTFKVR